MLNRNRLNKLDKDISLLSVEVCKNSVWHFARRYLPNIFDFTPCGMHLEICSFLKDVSEARNAKIAIAGPKDYYHPELIIVANVLWSICFEKESYLLLVSATSEQAHDILSQVKDELESNVLLKRDFPKIAGKNPRYWRRNGIITRNDIKIRTVGLNQKVSYRRYQHKLPSLVIFDLLQDHPADFDIEKKFHADFDRFQHLTNKPSDPNMNLVAVGTMMHAQSILARICSPSVKDLLRLMEKKWDTHVYKAILSEAENQELWKECQSIYLCDSTYKDDYGDESAKQFFKDHEQQMLVGSGVLWPEKEDYYALKCLEIKIGRKQFRCEKQNTTYNTIIGDYSPEEIKAALEFFEQINVGLSLRCSSKESIKQPMVPA